MRPSANPEVVVVLDKLPELKVIYDAANDSTFLKEHAEPFNVDTFRDTTVGRFRSETRTITAYDAPKAHPPFIEIEEWHTNPSFKVRTDDVEFVKAAAKRVLDQKNLSDYAFNIITRRRQAAKAITRILEI